MINLAFKSVVHGWRRYLPVGIAVGISGLMMVVQAGLAMGAFSLSAAPVRLSAADLWVGPADAAALDESRGLSLLAVGQLWLDPDVARIETYSAPEYVSIGEDEFTGEMGVVVALPLGADTMLFARAIGPDSRERLTVPGTVILDRTDARNLGVGVGDTIKVNRQSLRVVALASGMQAIFGKTLVMSELTARDVLQGMSAGSDAAFYLLRLRSGADPLAVAARLQDVPFVPEYRVWQPDELAAATVRSWAFGSGAGTVFVASSAIALVITLMVVKIFGHCLDARAMPFA